MSKYKEIAEGIVKEDLEEFYKTHLPKDCLEQFNIPSKYIFHQILKYLEIKEHTVAENTAIQFTYYDMSERNKKVAQSNTGRVVTEETRKKLSDSNKGIKKRATPTSFTKGNIPWNKELKGAQKWIPGQKEKYMESMNKRDWWGKKTKIEEEVEQELINQYGKENVIYQYWQDSRYPFNCDFYVTTEDLFIEVNRFWMHNNHTFDPTNEEDLKTLEVWKSKSDGNNQYAAAIKVWTETDPLKLQTAIKNNLNYKIIY